MGRPRPMGHPAMDRRACTGLIPWRSWSPPIAARCARRGARSRNSVLNKPPEPDAVRALLAQWRAQSVVRPFAGSCTGVVEIIRHDPERFEDHRVVKVTEIGTVDARERHGSGVRLVAGHRVRTPDHG